MIKINLNTTVMSTHGTTGTKKNKHNQRRNDATTETDITFSRTSYQPNEKRNQWYSGMR